MYILIEFLGLPFGATLQQLNNMFYDRLPRYIYECALFALVYKQLVQVGDWEQGVNEKIFLAKSPYNSIAGWVHDGDEETNTYGGLCMFNMILRDGTRSDNAFISTHYGVWFDRYDYLLPQNKRITAVTIYYY